MTLASPVSLSSSPSRAQAAAVPRDVSLGYLRAFVTVLVVLHHAVLGYGGMPVSTSFTEPPMLWRAFPVVDAASSWSLAMIIAGFNDIYFMSLMFLLSGLFVDASIRRKGVGEFVRDRLVRLGIPFLFAAFLISPLAYSFSWLQTGGAPELSAFWAAWISLGDWPTGPAWFIFLLLAFDLLIAGVYLMAPRWSEVVAGLSPVLGRRPGLTLLLAIAAAFTVYAPLSYAFGDQNWFSFGPFQFQSSRPLLYLLFFVAGIGIGTYGLGRGVLARDGNLARFWWPWLLIVAPAAFAVGFATVMTLMSGGGGAAQSYLPILLWLCFAIGCVSASFGWLGLFTRHVHAPNPVWESLSRNAYGIYLVHYVFVAAVQYALLPVDLGGGWKTLIVTATALALSWATAAALRRLPVASRLVGE